MKQILTFLMIFVSCVTFAQDPMYAGLENDKEVSKLYLQPLPYNQSTGKIEFQEIIDAPNKSKSEIYTAAREWFAKSFVSANAVLQMDDKDSGVLVGKGKIGSSMDILIKVETKDGRLRYTLTDIVYSLGTMKYNAEVILSDENLYRKNGSVKAAPKAIKEELLVYNAKFIQSIRNAINTNNSNDDW